MSTRPARPADAGRQPLLDVVELTQLIARGRALARRGSAAATDDGRHGGQASRHLGQGLDFAEHRRYLPGDDPRRIDWRATARSGLTQVRRQHEDRAPDRLLLVDRRDTMRFATRGHLKVTQAVRLAVLLAAYHQARNARVSLLVLDTRLQPIGPVGDAGLLAMGRQLAAPCPPDTVAGPGLAAALTRIGRQATQGTRVTLLSDFVDLDRLSASHWHRLARRHPLQLVRISDPAEIGPPLAPHACLGWSLHGQPACRPLDAALRKRLVTARALATQALATLTGQTGITLLELSTTSVLDDGLVTTL